VLDLLVDRYPSAILLEPLRRSQFPAWLKEQPPAVREWVKAAAFEARPATHLLVPDDKGRLARCLVGLEDGIDRWSWGALPAQLPPGTYRLNDALSQAESAVAALFWLLGGYRYERYHKADRPLARLVWPKSSDRKAVLDMAKAIYLVRDLINTPAEDMGPGELADAARVLARTHKAKLAVIVGEDLLKKDYPAIHAVGRASVRPPRLIDLRWGETGPRLTLVGKGVCFDSGGLDLKSAANMLAMKKDMGGAALMLGLAQLIMSSGLKVRLRLLIPAVENSVSGNAYRPLDVIRTRKGLSVEITNTDAEGRVILCDALAEADGEKPDLLIDAATLTGAARVALGPELPALFANNDKMADLLLHHGRVEDDPFWRLPLYKPYRSMLESKIADIVNAAEGPFGGAITAALYLQEFVSAATPWLHIDTYAANAKASPGRPLGGEALGLRALFAFVCGWATGGHGPQVITRNPAPRTAAKRTASRARITALRAGRGGAPRRR